MSDFSFKYERLKDKPKESNTACIYKVRAFKIDRSTFLSWLYVKSNLLIDLNCAVSTKDMTNFHPLFI